MASRKFGSFTLTYDDTKGWAVDLVAPLPINWRPPIFLCGIVPLLEKSKMGAPPYQPLYNVDKNTLYVSYVSADNDGFPRLVVGRLSEPRSEIIADIPFPSLPVGNYRLNIEKEETNGAYIMAGTTFLTFSPAITVWTFVLLRFTWSMQYPWIGVLGAVPIDQPSNAAFVVFTPPTDALQFEYPIAPTKDGILFRCVSLISHSEPAPQGSGDEKWAHARISLFGGNYLVVVSTHLVPKEGGSLLIAPRERILGFDTQERATVLSPYEELRWEWDDDNRNFIQISDTTRTPIAIGLPFETAYKAGFVICGASYAKRYYSSTVVRRETFMGVLTRLVQAPQPYKENVLNSSINIADVWSGITDELNVFPIHIEGDETHALFSSATNKVSVINLFTGEVTSPLSITKDTTTKRALYWTSPGVIMETSNSFYLIKETARAGTSFALPNADLYLPLWFPFVAPSGQYWGHFVLLRWSRQTLRCIIPSTADIAPNGEVIIRFAMPVTGDRIVTFAVENPPIGYLPYSYLGTSYIISDSSVDRFAWEMRVGDNEWKPLRGVLKRETPTAPPYEIRVRITPLYSPFVRVIMRAV